MLDSFLSLASEEYINYSLSSNHFSFPIAYKDNICTVDHVTTCASKMLENFQPCYDATVVARAKKKNLICFGKLNMDEFGIGSQGIRSAFSTPSSPLGNITPGGSSSGPAIAVLDDMVPVALGSDTGGSVRMPAARCGIFGMKQF